MSSAVSRCAPVLRRYATALLMASSYALFLCRTNPALTSTSRCVACTRTEVVVCCSHMHRWKGEAPGKPGLLGESCNASVMASSHGSRHELASSGWRHLPVKDHVKVPARHIGMVRAVGGRMCRKVQLPSVPAHAQAHSICLWSVTRAGCHIMDTKRLWRAQAHEQSVRC